MQLLWQAHVGGYVTDLWGLYRIVINTIALDTLVGVSLLKLFYLWHIIVNSQAVVHFLVTAEETTTPKETTVPGIRTD